MLTQILIPLDGSDLSRRILTPVKRLISAQERGQATLLRAFPSQGLGSRETRLQDARAELLSELERLKTKKLNVGIRVEEGDPAQVILDCASELQPGLVAMATHGHTGLRRLVRGSVAERVLRECEQPLLLCNPHGLSMGCDKQSPFMRILVPLDGTDVANGVLPLVEQLALVYGSEVVLLRVENSEPAKGTRRYDQIEGFLSHYAESLEASGVKSVKVLLTAGDPAGEILRGLERTRADLVAMSTHGRTGLARMRLGSVAEEVVRQSPCPLLVKRVAAAEGAKV